MKLPKEYNPHDKASCLAYARALARHLTASAGMGKWTGSTRNPFISKPNVWKPLVSVAGIRIQPSWLLDAPTGVGFEAYALNSTGHPFESHATSTTPERALEDLRDMLARDAAELAIALGAFPKRAAPRRR